MIPYADAHGYGYYHPQTMDLLRARIEGRLGTETLDKFDLWANKKWINYQMMEGKGLRDVGELPGMPQSDFYDLELNQVHGWNNGQGYPKYELDFQP